MKDISSWALNVATQRGACYADARIADDRSRALSTKNGKVGGALDSESFGIGVRVIADGAWGFAASDDLSRDGVEATAARAVDIAKASSRVKLRDIQLAPEKPVIAEWTTPFQIDPFSISVEQNIDLLLKIDAELRSVAGVTLAETNMNFRREEQWFVSSEDTNVHQTKYTTGVGYAAYAFAGSEIQKRSYPTSFGGQWQNKGYELIGELNLLENARRVGEEAVALLKAEQCPEGAFNVILEGSQLALQIHESVGHPIELDRVLGMEANFAGTSFLTFDKLRTLRYGSDLVNIVADARQEHGPGLGTFAFDEEGVPAQCTPIITNGLFTGYLSSRETAHTIGMNRSGGTLRAEGWNRLPIIRMTNIRANACSTTVSNGLVPTAITAVLSFNGGQTIVVNQTGAQTLAFVQQGLITGSTNATLVQCNNLNVGAGGIGGNFTGGTKAGIPVFAVTLTEGYAASFKRKTAAFLPSTITDVNDANNTSPLPQNVPGFNYNSESGFEPPDPGGPTLGNATQGDRFLLVFNNVNTGVNLWVPQYVALVVAATGLPGSPLPTNGGVVGTAAGAYPGWAGGWLELVGNSSDLNGNITSVAPIATASFGGALTTFFTSNPFKGPGASGPFANAVQLSGSGSTLTAVYEVVNADPSAIEAASIPIGVSYVANTPNNLPAPGQSTVTASFAPLSTVQTATATDPIPRWCNKSAATNSFKIQVCTCDLLFPFVTNASGFDTGIAIANTSLDVYGTAPQNGTVTLNFFGSLPGTPAPAPITAQTSSTINAGTELVFTLSGGNGGQNIQPEVGFQGYIIAVAQFQWCHGFAFISDLGAQKLAEGYLAIQLDFYAGSGLNRTGIVGEVQGH